MRRTLTRWGLAVPVLTLLPLILTGCGAPRYMDRDAVLAEPTVCAERRFEVYFADSQAGLTAPARETIRLTAAQLGDCDIQRVRVIGLSDARGGASANQSLSERRAVAVAEALTAAGWPAPAFELEAAGEDGAVTDSGAREPMRRRTEVVVEAAPPL